MKKLMPAILLLTLFSKGAFATHAYRSENCKSLSHDLIYKGNYPVGGPYGISNSESNEDISALPQIDMETPNTLDDAEVIFSEVASKVIKQGAASSECGFDHEEWTSEKIITIDLISKEAAKTLNLHQGDKLTLICEESTDYPNNSECN